MNKWALALGLILCGCTGTPQWEAAVTYRNNNGANCAEYARIVRDGMAAKGQQAYLVTYTLATKDAWTRHQIVMYFVGQERWMMDNAGRKPVWVGSTSDPLEKCLEQFHAGRWVYVSWVVVE